MVMGGTTIRRSPITLCEKQGAPSRGSISRATAGDRIRCSGRLRPASFAVWQALPSWRFTKQFRIICAESRDVRRGKMGQDTTYAGITKLVTPDNIIVPTTRYAAVGSTGAGS